MEQFVSSSLFLFFLIVSLYFNDIWVWEFFEEWVECPLFQVGLAFVFVTHQEVTNLWQFYTKNGQED